MHEGRYQLSLDQGRYDFVARSLVDELAAPAEFRLCHSSFASGADDFQNALMVPLDFVVRHMALDGDHGGTGKMPDQLDGPLGIAAPRRPVTETRSRCAAGPPRRPRCRRAGTERRPKPPAPFQTSRTYSYPTGDGPEGANCLGDCGKPPAIDYSAVLDRGRGHARAGTTRIGVNGLYDMGANAWEWVDTEGEAQKGTRGGSWWYGAAQMRVDHDASKPPDMAVVYIGFRCVKDLR